MKFIKRLLMLLPRIESKCINQDSGKTKKIFIAADLHLDHKNIIKYCSRPFKSVRQMNRILIKNWNKTVGKNDMVYFLGDLAFGRGSKNTDYWIKKLKGEIIFIKGNHDRSKTIRFHKVFYFTYKGIDFVLVHSPFNSPVGWKNWIIHGHEHNHSINFPFIDKKTKRINVSCELTDYCPVDIDIIINKIKESDA